MNKRLYKKKKGLKMEYYYYILTSNSTCEIKSKKVKDNPDKTDINNVASKNYFIKKDAAISAADKFLKELQKCFTRREK